MYFSPTVERKHSDAHTVICWFLGYLVAKHVNMVVIRWLNHDGPTQICRKPYSAQWTTAASLDSHTLAMSSALSSNTLVPTTLPSHLC